MERPQTVNFCGYWVGLVIKDEMKAIYLRGTDHRAPRERTKQLEAELRKVLPLRPQGKLSAEDAAHSRNFYKLRARLDNRSNKGIDGFADTLLLHYLNKCKKIPNSPAEIHDNADPAWGASMVKCVDAFNLIPRKFKPPQSPEVRELRRYLKDHNIRKIGKLLEDYLANYNKLPETADDLVDEPSSSTRRYAFQEIEAYHRNKPRAGRRMAQRESSSRRDSPVTLPILEEIGRAQQKSERRDPECPC